MSKRKKQYKRQPKTSLTYFIQVYGPAMMAAGEIDNYGCRQFNSAETFIAEMVRLKLLGCVRFYARRVITVGGNPEAEPWCMVSNSYPSAAWVTELVNGKA